MTIPRRDFIARSAMAVAGVLATHLDALAISPSAGIPTQAPTRRGAPKRVIIVGAGLAGLSAGHELVRAGHEVTILEAQGRPGGRVFTLRDHFPEDLHAEAGATRIPNHHHFTLGYVKQFGLPLEPFRPAGVPTVDYARGHRFVVPAGEEPVWPYDLTAEERKLGLAGIRAKHVGALLDSLGDVTDAAWPSDALKKYDMLNRSKFWAERGASQGAIDLLSLGGFDDRADLVSALFMLRNSALNRGATGYSKITGGNDRLPKAFAMRLAQRIRYRSPVFRIEHDTAGVTVRFRTAGGIEAITGDRVICAVPFPVQRNIEVWPPLTVEKQRAIEQLPYRSITKIFLQSRERFWVGQGLDGFAVTDLPIREVWDMSYNQPGRRGILQAYPMSFHARRLAGLSEAERLADTLEQVERVYPGIRANYEGGVTKSWDDDEWARGASAFYKPGQLTTLLPHVARPEGRIHFAGEHTSVWIDGWMQGALESGNRVAHEINAA